MVDLIGESVSASITLLPLSAPFASGTDMVVRDVGGYTSTTDGNGDLSLTLKEGDYRVMIRDCAWTITVPSGSSTYNATALISAGAAASAAPAYLLAASNLSDLANASTALTNLGAQPLDGDLTAIAALAPSNDDLLQRKAGAWTNRTPAQVKSDLAIAQSDVTGLVAALAAKEPTQTAASQAEAEAGSGTSIRSWTPERIAQAIAALAGAGGGKLVAWSVGESATVQSTTSVMNYESLPTSSQGVEVVTVAHQAASVSNTLLLLFIVNYDSFGNLVVGLFRDSVTPALKGTITHSAWHESINFFKVTPPDTNAHTYKVRCGPTSATLYINRSGTFATSGFFGAGNVRPATLLCLELAP